MLLRVEAINLKTIPYSESSRIIIVFTREMGRMGLMAKGVRKSKQSEKGKLQSFMHNTYIINKNTGMGIISAVDNLHSFYELQQNLKKLEAAYNCLNMVYHIVAENHPNEPLFNLLLQTLHTLETNAESEIEIALNHFKKELVRIEGLLPPAQVSDYSIDRTLERYLNTREVKF